MNKLTAERCLERIDKLKTSQRRFGISMLEEDYLQALEIALPILEQQEVITDSQPVITDSEGMITDSAELGEGWIEWKGGDCPVSPPRQEVEYLTRIRNKHINQAGDLRWHHEGWGGDIIAYRVIENDGRED